MIDQKQALKFRSHLSQQSQVLKDDEPGMNDAESQLMCVGLVTVLQQQLHHAELFLCDGPDDLPPYYGYACHRGLQCHHQSSLVSAGPNSNAGNSRTVW